MAPLTTPALDELANDIAGDVLTDHLSRAMYSTAAGIYQIVPLVVVRPRDRIDIVTALRWAAANEVPLTPRGGGTSPVDGCLGKGLVLDTSAYMCSETDIDLHGEVVAAPPGATVAQINNVLSRFGRYLPPSPPAADYRTIGGVVATNAAGIHSVKYGAIIDYVASLEVTLADGTVLETRAMDTRKNDFKEYIEGAGRAEQLHADLYQLLRDKRGLIRSRMPKLPVNTAGYRLDRALARGVLDLGQLVTGSEGTLGAITKVALRTAEPPAMRGTLILYFETVQLAADCVRPILDAEPCSVEMVDARALELVRANRPDLGHFFREEAQSVLLVEFDGADNDEVIPKLLDTEKLMTEQSGVAMDAVVATAEPDVEEAQDLRTAARNMLYNIPGPRRVTPFIEDIAVGPDMISSCVHGLTEVMKRHGIGLTLNGHIGQGSFCARPLLDLGHPDHVKTMREVAEEVFTMVVDMGGTISAGHGDGLARTEFLRLQYGDLCDVFAEVKRLFDPKGLLNPGVKVGAERGTITSNLRFTAGDDREPVEPQLLYPGDSRPDALERCHGCGACRTVTDIPAMCPVYKVLRTEEASPRAKANILRHLLTGRGALPPEDEVVAEMTRLTDLCVGCKMCSVQCPASIDVAKLMVELRARRREKGGLSRDERFAKWWPNVLPFLAAVAPAGNMLLQSRVARFLLEKTVGLAARRDLPRFRVLELAGRHKPTLTQVRDRVVYFTGVHADCFDPDVLQCSLDVLLRNGVEVEVVSGLDSGETRMTYGDVAGARKAVERVLKRMTPLVADGFRVVFADPRTALFFKKGMLDCIDSDAARAVAGASFDLLQFLLSLHRAGRLDTRFRAVPVPLGYHAPCHLRALQIGRPALELLRLVPELPVADLGGGCCGMAGTFGLRAPNFDLSMLIGRPLFEQLKNLEVRYGLTECSACAMQLQQGSGKLVLHPIQILHRAYGMPQQGLESW